MVTFLNVVAIIAAVVGGAVILVYLVTGWR